MKYVFMGTPEFASFILGGLIEKNLLPLAVYSQPPKRSKRGMQVNYSPVSKLAISHKIPHFHPAKLSRADAEYIKELQPDFIIVVAYGLLLPSFIFDLPLVDTINLHASKLPRWRGAAPMQRAIMNHDKLTAMQIIKVVKKLDQGCIYASKDVAIEASETFETLHDKMKVEGLSLLLQFLADYNANKKLICVEQSNENITYAHKIDDNDRAINFSDSGKNIDASIRGLSPFPGAYGYFLINEKKTRVKLLDSFFHAGKNKSANPELYIEDNKLYLNSLDGIVEIKKIQREGKKSQNIKEFLHAVSSISLLHDE